MTRQRPRQEADWDVRACGKCAHAAQVASHLACAGVMPLAAAAKRHLSQAIPTISAVAWAEAESSASVFATENFMRTLVREAGDDLSMYLRSVDAFVLLPSGSALLLSEREADALLDAAAIDKAASAAGSSAAPSVPSVLHLRYTSEEDMTAAGGGQARVELRGRTPTRAGALLAGLQCGAVVSMQLFNGETMFGYKRRKDAAAGLLPTAEARSAALGLATLRGNRHLLARSQLEEICDVG